MTWEHGRQLSSLQTADNSVSYKYDSNGMRTQKDVDGTKTYYYYDNDKNLIGLTKGNYTLLFYYDLDGNVTSFKYNGTMYYYIKNLQGDVVKIINQSGTECLSYVYDAWGNTKSASGNPILRELNPFRYRSYVYDEETGLYYLQSRYYDPFTGRFLNADIYCDTQTGSPLSTNMFAYCENNAVNKIDPSGYWSFSSDWIAYSIDLIIAIFAAPVSICFTAIKTAVKTYIKSFGIKKTAKYIVKYILPACKRFMIRFVKQIGKIINKVTWFTIDYWRTSKITSFINKLTCIFKGKKMETVSYAVFMFLSVGSYIAGIFDLISDGKLDGRVTI